MSRYDFLIETYRTERIKTLSVWAQVPDERLSFRPEPRARTAHEHMVHQCLSEEAWMTKMLGIGIELSPLPPEETRQRFLEHYAAASALRLRALDEKPDDWFEADTQFFDTTRSRAWVLTRRLTHSAHHRGQLIAYLRLWGLSLYSTYGPTADTGGLAANGASVIYRSGDVDGLLADTPAPPLPGTGRKPGTERP
jgi:uncharacterized damage-inducible protein DinB